jgi:hypothetical protein
MLNLRCQRVGRRNFLRLGALGGGPSQFETFDPKMDAPLDNPIMMMGTILHTLFDHG